VQFADTRTSHLLAFLRRGWISEEDALFDVALHLPNVGRMRFGDVDNVKCYSIRVLLIQLVERGNLPAEWRSGVATKHEYDRLHTTKRGKPYLLWLVQQRKREIGRCISDLKPAASSMLPHGFERKQKEGSRPGMHHQAREALRWLVHCIVEANQCGAVR
jgi:hypothetical protein